MTELEKFNQRAREMFEPYVGKEIVVHFVIPFKSEITGELMRVTDETMIIAGHGVIPYGQVALTARTYGATA